MWTNCSNIAANLLRIAGEGFVLSQVRKKSSFFIFSLALLVLTLAFSVPHTLSATAGFSFASAGDAATLTSGDGMNSLSRLATSATDFFLGLGDYSYNSGVASSKPSTTISRLYPVTTTPEK